MRLKSIRIKRRFDQVELGINERKLVSTHVNRTKPCVAGSFLSARNELDARSVDDKNNDKE